MDKELLKFLQMLFLQMISYINVEQKTNISETCHVKLQYVMLRVILSKDDI